MRARFRKGTWALARHLLDLDIYLRSQRLRLTQVQSYGCDVLLDGLDGNGSLHVWIGCAETLVWSTGGAIYILADGPSSSSST